MGRRYQALRGTRDILPDEVSRWRFLEETARTVFRRYHFREIRTPLLEATELFARSVGESSDIVRKEMYTFRRGEDSISLRPESTASVARAFVEHALYRNVAAGYPERYFYIGPMFRHERPQRGRQRQFHQIGVEVFGAAEPNVDAETIEMVELFLDELGIEDREVLLSTVGDEVCRPGYRRMLQRWLEPRLAELCEDCQRRAVENPLRVLDCKVEADQRLLAEAPTLIDHLCDGCGAHFAELRRELDHSGVSYRVERRLVRGLDYYSRTVFEVVARGLGAQNAILGGGRYDGLVEQLGGPAVPAFGFAMGMERTILLLPTERVPAAQVDVALVLIGERALERGRRLARLLRERGRSVLLPVIERPLAAQLKRANRAGARLAVIVGEEELARDSYALKDLRSGKQVKLDERGLLARIGADDEA